MPLRTSLRSKTPALEAYQRFAGPRTNGKEFEGMELFLFGNAGLRMI
jgi:hypothetical protein